MDSTDDSYTDWNLRKRRLQALLLQEHIDSVTGLGERRTRRSRSVTFRVRGSIGSQGWADAW